MKAFWFSFLVSYRKSRVMEKFSTLMAFAFHFLRKFIFFCTTKSIFSRFLFASIFLKIFLHHFLKLRLSDDFFLLAGIILDFISSFIRELRKLYRIRTYGVTEIFSTLKIPGVLST